MARGISSSSTARDSRGTWATAPELTGLARHCGNFHYIPVRHPAERRRHLKGRSGYLQNLIASGEIEIETGLALTPENFDIFPVRQPRHDRNGYRLGRGARLHRDKGHDIGTLHTEEYW